VADKLIVWDGKAIERAHLRSLKIAIPDLDVSSGQPLVEARIARDMVLPLMANAVATADTSSLDNRLSSDLDAIGAAEGIARPPAVGASGYVLASTATGGATIFAGDEWRPKGSKTRYQCAVTALYADGDQVPVVGLDVGPGTNLPAGTEGEWSNPRTGCSPSAAVWSEGLTGGRDQANAEEYKSVIVERRARPAVGANEAAYLALIEDPKATGIAVQRAFVWPAITGTGMVGASFTMRPASPGGSRLPSEAQLAIMLAALEGTFYGDDGIVMISIAEEPATLKFRATWKKAAAGWASSAAWPPYNGGVAVYVDNGAAITASAMRVTSASATDAPLVGQVIGLFNTAAQIDGETRPGFERKTILTVTEVVAGESWDLTFDMAAGASSVFVPANGALVSPWSDSLNLIVPPVVAYFDGMGPGEMLATLPDPGRRARRQPENPESWPSIISNRLDALVQGVSAVRSATLVEPSTTEATSTGTLGVLAYLRRLTDMAVYSE